MLLKSADEKKHFVTQLQDILTHPSLARERKPFVEKEIRSLQSRIETETLSARAIDEYLESSEQVVVLHDLRLSHNGKTVQVDHVLINQTLEVAVLHTQLFTASLKVSAHGAFEKVVSGRTSAIASPLEEARKSLEAVKDAIRTVRWPSRLGLQPTPQFRAVVLLGAGSSITRSAPTSFPAIQSVDEFLLEYGRANGSLRHSLTALTRGVSVRVLEKAAQRLRALHRPFAMDVDTRFGLRVPRALRLPASGLPVSRERVALATADVPVRLPVVERAISPDVEEPLPVTAVPTSAIAGSSPAPAPLLEAALDRAESVSRPMRQALAPERLEPAKALRAIAPSPRPTSHPASRSANRPIDSKALRPAGPAARLGTSEPRKPVLRVPDQPESFRQDKSLHAELLRPRGTSEYTRAREQRREAQAVPAPQPAAADQVSVPEVQEATVVVPETVITQAAELAVQLLPGVETVVVQVAVTPVSTELEPEPEPAVATVAAVPPSPPTPPARPSAQPFGPRTDRTERPTRPAAPKPAQGYYCKDCTAEVTTQMAKFCWQNKVRFGGRVYCASCQEKHPIPSFPRREPRPVSVD
jgi:hypothetical protein